MKKLKYLSFISAFSVIISCEGSISGSDPKAKGDNLADETIYTEMAEEQLAKQNFGNLIDYDEAKVLIQTYQSDINTTHFSYGSNRIAGYVFTRGELLSLLTENDSTELFLMWGLSGQGPNKYLNLIIAKAINKKMDLNGDFLISGANAPYTVSDLEKFDSIHGKRIPIPDLDSLSQLFRDSGNMGHIVKGNDSIKGYALTQVDINDLIRNGKPLTDTIIFIPMITPKDSILNEESPFYGVDHLGIAFGKIDGNGKCVGNFRDYCDPCPSKCMNYNVLF